jgi:AbrB family looped-hinge helix DNA binding protein
MGKDGRVVIPKVVRDELQLKPGQKLNLESEGDRITLRRLRSGSPLRKEHGFWVFHGGEPLSVAEASKLISNSREQRARRNFGEDS